MKFFDRVKQTKFLIAICLPFLALGIQWLFWVYFKPFVWFLFFPTVFFSARLGGLKGGIISTVLSAVIVYYFFFDPQLSWQINNHNNLFSLVVFVFMGFLFSDVQERLSRANRSTEKALNETREAKEKIDLLYEQTRQLDDLKSHFFANVSHELRTPLTLILESTANMVRNPVLDQESLYSLQVVERNARMLYRQVCDILDISKLEAGRMQMNFAHTDFVQLCHIVVSQFESVAHNKNITFTVNSPEMLSVVVDIEKCQRILLNLLSNAFKFTPDNGEIQLDIKAEKESVIIEIQDSGSGIPENMRDKVFERFQQVEGSLSNRFGGTGLGLAIVKEFVELHGGTIKIYDSSLGGALFRITLSTNISSDAPDIKYKNIGNKILAKQINDDFFVPETLDSYSLAEQSKDNLPLILVVEDNPDMNNLITHSLSDTFRVVSAFNGSEGFEKALSIIPDLIVTDYMMPGMTGEELVEQIRNHPKIAEIPVVMLTAKADDKVRLKLLQDKVQDYLIKPFSTPDLVSRVTNLVYQYKKQKRKLDESEERFRILINQAADGFFIHDNDGNIIDANNQACDSLGYSKDELLKMTVLDIEMDFDLEKLQEIWNSIELGQHTFVYGHQRRKDGSIFPVEVSVSMIEFNGQRLAFDLVRDISERMQAQEELRKSEEQYRSALDNMLEGCQIISFDWEYLYMNQSAANFGHKTREELIGHKMTEVYPNIETQPIYEHLKKSMEDRVSTHVEVDFIYPDNTDGWFELSIQPVPEGLFILSVDITNRKKAEEAIIELEERFSKAFYASPVGLLITRFDSGQIVDANDAYCQMIGYLRTELIQNTTLELHIWENTDDRARLIDMLKNNIPVRNLEMPIRKGTGESRIFQISMELIEILHQKCVVSFALDITERKKDEESLRHNEMMLKQQNEEYSTVNEELNESNQIIQKINEDLKLAKEKAEESDRLKSAFLANMSHEIRTPMNAIIGFSNIVGQHALPEDKIEKFTNLIQQRSYDLLHIIDDILDISKLEVGQMKLAFSPVQLSGMLYDILEYYQLKIQEICKGNDLSIKLMLPKELSEVIINTDSSRIKQIFNNLIDNAIKFTESGEVVFGCKSVKDHEFVFFVKDSGIGIPKEKHEIIFDRFRQADELFSTRKYGGTGLGLSIVKGIIKLLNGRIWLESEPGMGTTFYFALPFTTSEIVQNSNQHLASAQSRWSGKTILIVEDDEANNEFLQEVLRSSGVNMLIAFTGSEALDIVNNEKHIDLILMDIRLPDINGLILTSMIKQQRPQICILAQTAYTSSADIQECYEAGCDDYIAKPIGVKKLLSKLDVYLNPKESDENKQDL